MLVSVMAGFYLWYVLKKYPAENAVQVKGAAI
jgi:hypothetical protein